MAKALRDDSDVRTTVVLQRMPVYVAALLLLLIATACLGSSDPEKQLIGWLEKAEVSAKSLVMVAKVDTGADYSSVHAEDVRFFDRDGKPWVTFVMQDYSGNHYTLRRPVKRTVRIKKKDGGFQKRPVVMLQLCVGHTTRTVSVNLAQRAHFEFPLLVGRDFLSGHFVVDPGREYLSTPVCR